MLRRSLEEEEEQRALLEKEKALQGIDWQQEKKLQMFGDVSHIHKLRLEEKEYIFEEKKISGMGRVIIPLYDICGDDFVEPIPECIDGKWHWTFIKAAKQEKLPMSEAEERAYKAVYHYGCFMNG